MQQYLFDANDAESWMSDQELYMMMVEDRAKDEFSTQNLKKKHEILETSVEDYAETVRQLEEAARQLMMDTQKVKQLESELDKLTSFMQD